MLRLLVPLAKLTVRERGKVIAQQIRELVDSLSIWSGAMLVAVLSATFVWLLSSRFFSLRTLWGLIIPVVIAYCLYWSPVWLGNDASEYDAWALAFIVPWWLTGAISSAAILRILEKRRAR